MPNRGKSLGFHDIGEESVVEFVGRGAGVIGDNIAIVKPPFVNATGIITVRRAGRF